MKYNFNDSSIVTSYIKELLHSFNLPILPIATEGTVYYEGRPYIDNNNISIYKNNQLNRFGVFVYNYPYTNITKKYNINSSVYDIKTHEYLGEYLRFIRDYNHVNLMPLYNCFSDNRLVKIDKTLEYDNGKRFIIDTDDNNIYYSIPVKFNKNYTIAMSSPKNVELACVYYYNNGILERSSELKDSYIKLSNISFNNPILYSTSLNISNNPLFTGWNYENSLRLILKTSKTTDSSITILEGDYTKTSKTIDGLLLSEVYGVDRFKTSKLSLLEVDNHKSYPFSDRLVEYLMSNAISPLDKIDSNIMMVQALIYDDYLRGVYGTWDKNVEDKLYLITRENNILKGKTEILSNYIIECNPDGTEKEGSEERKTRRYIDSYSDTLYYVDKDLEQMIGVR